MEPSLIKTCDFRNHLIQVNFIVIPHLLGICVTRVILHYLTSTQFLKIGRKNPIWYSNGSQLL